MCCYPFRYFFILVGLLVNVTPVVVYAQDTDVPRFAYIANPYDYTLLGYYINEEGRLIPNGMVFTGDKFPATLASHPNNKFIYTASRTVDLIPIYKVDPVTGWLSEAPGSHFDSRLRSPFSYAFYPGGKFLYVAGRGGGVAGFSVDPVTGSLDYVPHSPFKAGERTRCIAMHPSGKFVYASNAYTNNVSAYRINEQTGELTELPHSPFFAGEEGPFDDTFAKLPDVDFNRGGLPYYIAIHPSGKFAYVTNWMAGSVSIFRIDENTGDLTLIGKPKVTGLTPYAVAVHPSGKFVYVSTWGGNDVWVYSVDPQSGALEQVKGSPYETHGLKPVDINISRDGLFVYVANISSNNVTVFSLDRQSGALTFKDLVMARAGAIDLELVYGKEIVKVSPYRAFLLNKAAQQLVMYEVDAQTGAFKELGSAKTGKDPTAIAQDPKNRFVYVANAGDNTVSAYALGAAGDQLKAVEGSPYAVGAYPYSVAVDANGWYFYVLNKTGNNMSVFLIHQRTGQLAEAQGSPVDLMANPGKIVLDPTARFTYVVNPGAKSISVYRFREAITAAIFEITEAGSPFHYDLAPDTLDIDPTGRFTAVVNSDRNKVSINYIDMASGGLYATDKTIKGALGGTYETGDRPVMAKFHPNGNYLYVLNQKSQSITSFKVNRLTGVLTRAAEAIATQGEPLELTLDPSGKFAYVRNAGVQGLYRFTVDPTTGQMTFNEKMHFSFNPDDLTVSRVFH